MISQATAISLMSSLNSDIVDRDTCVCGGPAWRQRCEYEPFNGHEFNSPDRIECRPMPCCCQGVHSSDVEQHNLSRHHWPTESTERNDKLCSHWLSPNGYTILPAPLALPLTANRGTEEPAPPRASDTNARQPTASRFASMGATASGQDGANTKMAIASALADSMHLNQTQDDGLT